MLAPELLSRIRRLELKAGHLASELMLGEYASAFKGRGWDFDELREYHQGDDLRRIDWNVTARTGTPHIKLYHEERDRTVLLMLDVSSSLFFAGRGRSKHEVAAELAAVLAFLAIRHKDKVGLVLFSDHVEKYIPPSKGRSHIWNIIRSVLGHRAQGQKTDVDGALRFVMQVRKRRSLCFLISDFWAPAYHQSLEHLAQRHELICCRITDSREQELPAAGLVLLQDQEQGEQVLVDSSSPQVQSRWQKLRKREVKEWSSQLRGKGISPLLVSTEENTADALHRFLREREQRRKRRR